MDATPSLGAGEKLKDDAVPVPGAMTELVLEYSDANSAGRVPSDGRSAMMSIDGATDDEMDGRDSSSAVVEGGPCANAA